jgi:uncharacterized repeat protein (TIGR01451 family)
MIRGLILHLLVLVLLSACAAGSGRQGTQVVVSGSGPTSAVQGGSNAVFVMTVTNTGPYDASNIKLIDNVGDQLKLISITCAASGGATCPAAPGVQMTIPSLPNGGALVFSVTVQLVNGASGTIQNTMTASFANEINPTGASNAVSATAVSTVTNVIVSGAGPSGTLTGGSPAVFVMTVTNNGPDATGTFNVYDNVGSGLSLTGITCAASGGATCPATVGILTTVPVLPSGGVLSFTVTTQVGQNVNGTVSNGIVVNIGSNPNQSANSFYATANVATAVLDVSGTPPAGPLLGGASGVFTLVVTNNGPATAQNITISNSLSAGITASGAITCAASAGVSCPATLGPSMTLASLPAAGVLTFTIPFSVNLGTSGQVSDTMTVSSSTDPGGNRVATVGVGSGSSDLVVTETGLPQVGAGTNAVFTATVTNIGPSPANSVTITYALSGPAGTVATVTCSAPAGVTCPTTLGPTMTVPTLGIGRVLTFTFTVAVPSNAAGQGAIVNTVTANAAGNGDLTQNVASYSSLPINANNGTYQVFAADTNQYSMVVNFDALNYTISGNGKTIQRNFTADTTGGGYTVSGTSRFRVATDLIVGGEDFGTGVIPYVAGRVFGTTVQQLAAQYDLMSLDFPSSGPHVTYAGTARVSGNTMSICQSSTQVATPQSCGSLPAGSLQNYTLTVNGNVYAAANTASPQSFSFQVGMSGAASVILNSGTAPDGSREFLIGLPDAASLAGGVTQGSSTTGDWVTMTLTPSSYASTGQLGSSDTAPLHQINTNVGPFSMLVGNRASDNAQIYVMQAYPLSIAVGATSGAASGLLQVTVP